MPSFRQKIRMEIQLSQFRPSLLSWFVNPYILARRELFHTIAQLPKDHYPKILDVGCGTKPYKDLFDCKEYLGLEIDTPSARNSDADFFYSGKIFPFNDQEFDLVICNQVLEHVFNPKEFLSEINRVLKPNGKVLLTVPFIWDEHEQPNDFGRYTSFGILHVFSDSGFQVSEHRKLCSGTLGMAQLISANVFKALGYTHTKIAWALCAFVNLSGYFISKAFKQNHDFYLDNFVFAVKPQKK